MAHYCYKKGKRWPLCANINCDESVTYVRKNKNGTFRHRSFCSNCYNAGRPGSSANYKPGVKPIKKTYCENRDGHIDGRKCRATCLDPSQLELDHIDGNHKNNSPENIETLCKNCHSKKSVLEGDFGRTYKS